MIEEECSHCGWPLDWKANLLKYVANVYDFKLEENTVRRNGDWIALYSCEFKRDDKAYSKSSEDLWECVCWFMEKAPKIIEESNRNEQESENDDIDDGDFFAHLNMWDRETVKSKATDILEE